MTKRFVVLDGDLDRATRVRLAIIHGTAMDRNARIITTDDVKS
jgi:plasmid stability protein